MNLSQFASQLRVAFRLLQDPLIEDARLLQHFLPVALRKRKIEQPLRRRPNHIAQQLTRQLQVLSGLIALGVARSRSALARSRSAFAGPARQLPRAHRAAKARPTTSAASTARVATAATRCLRTSFFSR